MNDLSPQQSSQLSVINQIQTQPSQSSHSQHFKVVHEGWHRNRSQNDHSTESQKVEKANYLKWLERTSQNGSKLMSENSRSTEDLKRHKSVENVKEYCL